MNQKIVRLTTENVKKLTAVQITPEGNLVIIGGKNGAGKSSVLDSIMYALAGGDSLPSKPVRSGEDKAKIELDLGDIIVKRTFTATGGTALVVTNKDGVRFSSPQAMLDGLVGRLSFDPLDFASQKPDEQSATLQSLIGVNFDAEETESKTIYDERTVVNREVKSLQSRLQAMPFHADATGDEESAESILANQKEASEHNAKNAAVRRGVITLENAASDAKDAIHSIEANIRNAKQEIVRWNSALKNLEQDLAEAQKLQIKSETDLQNSKAIVAALKDKDLGPFQTAIRNCETRNRKLRENKQKTELQSQLQAKNKEVESLTNRIEAIDKKKRQTLAAAKFPVNGLGLDDVRQVTFNGLPFSQASTAEQLRVSVAIGLAMNKKLPILLIRRGSDLDSDSLKMVAEMATAADAQVWLERVGTDGPVSVIIEDGHIAGIATTKENE